MTQVDPKIEKFIQETYPLMNDGDWDEVYRLASNQLEFKVSDLTQVLWDCDVHPELEGLTKIPRRFAGDLMVSGVRLNDRVTEIGEAAFEGCSYLEFVSLGSKVTVIGEFAFSRCYALDGIQFRGTTKQWNSIKKQYAWWHYEFPLSVFCTDGTVVHDWGENEEDEEDS